MKSISPADEVCNLFDKIVRSVTCNIQCYCTDPISDFSRSRKLPPDQLIKFIVCSESKSIPSELCSYFSADVPSASAFCQQRAKLLPEALRRVFHLSTSACIDSAETYHGWSLLACDGSAVNIPDNPDDPDTRCKVSGMDEYYNQLHLNALFDCQNDIFYDCSIDTSQKAGEARALIKMIRDRNYPEKSIIIADRGYENYELMAECLERNQKFLIRLKDTDSNGILSTVELPESEFDVPLRRILTRRQSEDVKNNPSLYRYMPWNQSFSRLAPGMETDYEMNFRVVRLQLENGVWECLVTNLSEEEFSPEQLREIYHWRWNEETGFRKLKYTAGMLNFRSRKRMNIEQEIYGRLTLFNLNALLILRTKKDEKQQRTKHRYKACFATAMTNLREFLKGRITGPELGKRVKKYLVPERPDRKALRRKRNKSVKSFNYRAA